MTAKGLSPATINGMRATLGAALSQAFRWNLVARNAVRLVDAPLSRAHRSDAFWAPDEADGIPARR